MINSLCGGRRRWIEVAGLCLLVMSTACTDVIDVDLCADDRSKVGKVTVAPRTWTLDVGDSLLVHVDVVNRAGNWSLCLPPPSFFSSDTLVARVIHDGGLLSDGGIFSQSGTAVGVKKGQVYIRATADGVKDSLLLTVVSSP